MRHRSGLAGLLLSVLLALVLAGAAEARDVLRTGVQLEPPNLDPTAGAAAAIDEVVTYSVFETLVKMGPNGQPEPLLAESWEVSPDGRIYLFHLRRGVKFQDGAPFDASVVKFSLDRARAPGSANAQKAYLEQIERVEVIDPLTVRLVLRQPSSSLIYVLTWGDAAMVSPRSAATNAVSPVGTGPFRVASWRRGESVTLERNPGYWGPPPRLRQIVMRFIADPTAAYSALRAGDLDAFPNYPAPENLAELKRDPRFKVVVGSTEGETILALNNRKPPLSDLRVRRALAHAIDRRAIIQGAMFGYGQPIGSHYPPQDPGYVDLTGLYPHDVARARALLAEAGYPNGFDVTLKLPPPSYARRSGEIVAEQLRQVGVRVKIQNLEWSQWLDQVLKNHDFDMTIVSHTEPMDYDIYGRDYYFGYRSAAFDTLLAQLNATVEPKARLAVLGQIQRKIAEDEPNVFLFEFPKLGVWDAHVKGVATDEAVQANEVYQAWFDEPGSAQSASAGRHGGAGWALWLLAVPAAFGLLGLARLGPRYVGGRALSLGLTFVAASLVVFLLIQVLPGDPASYMMGLNARPDAVAAVRAQLGLDAPAPQRYLDWILGLVRGDLGVSYTYRVPVAELVGERLQVSGPLAALALLLSILVALPVGLYAAARRGRAGDLVAMGAAQVGVALGALILPAIALALPQAAILARVLRSALVETLAEDYVRTARAKGLSEGQVLWRHALRNALAPTLSILGLQFPFLLAGAVVIENVFFLPGIGRLVFQAITQRDLIVVQSVVVILVLTVVLVNFLVDIGYGLVDPRIGRRR